VFNFFKIYLPQGFWGIHGALKGARPPINPRITEGSSRFFLYTLLPTAWVYCI